MSSQLPNQAEEWPGTMRSQDGKHRLLIQEYQPDYLSIFPNWCPELAPRRDVFQPLYTHVYAGGQDVTLGDDNMVACWCRWEVE